MTITEIALAAGVSIATVSRVLNNKDVSQKTREKVESTILKLNYIPESMAHAIVKSSTKAIAVVTHSMSNNYSMEFAEAASDYYLENDIMFYLGCASEPNNEYRYLMDLMSRGFNGVILHDPPSGNYQTGLYDEISKRIPVVIVHSFPSEFKINSITVDQRSGMRQAMRYLLSMGHRDIALVTGTEGYSFELKENVWKEELSIAGIEPDPLNVLRIPRSDVDDAIEQTEKIVSIFLASGRKPTAIFASNDLMGVGARLAIQDAGLVIPRDISLMSHDNTILASSSRLSSVDMKIRSVALAAVDLMKYATSGEDATPRHISITPELVLRGSVARLGT